MARKSASSKTTKIVEETVPEIETPEVEDPIKILGKRELIDRVVESSGIKKKAAKPVVEAMLRELGDALSRSETLNLQPFGKAIVKNVKSLENAEVVEMRLRRSRQAMEGGHMNAGQSDDEPTGFGAFPDAAE